MGGFQVDISNLDSEHPIIRRLRPHILLDLTNEEDIHRLNVAEADLTDKSKFDVLGSTVAYAQALWFCAQSVARVRQGLAISLLEISTVAHVALSAFTLGLWWTKPQSVNRGHVILHQPTQPLIERMIRYEKIVNRVVIENEATFTRKEHYFFANLFGRSKHTGRIARQAVKNSAMREAKSESPFLQSRGESLWMFHIDQSRDLRDRWFSYDLYFWAAAAYWSAMAVYGAVHVSAWNAHFPSSIERTLWLVACVLIVVVALFHFLGIILIYWLGSAKYRDVVPSPNGSPVRYSHTLGFLAVGAHAYLFIASWIGLRSLPVSAFETLDWTAAFPHWS